MAHDEADLPGTVAPEGMKVGGKHFKDFEPDKVMNSKKLKEDRIKQGRYLAQKRYDDDVNAVKKIMKSYDVDDNKALDQQEVKKMLKNFTMEKFGRRGVPTDAELVVLWRLCDQDGNGHINGQEIVLLLDLWFAYLERSEDVRTYMAEFALGKEGDKELLMRKPELKSLLVHLNKGKNVPDQVVDWVFSEADVIPDKELNEIELARAIATWHIYHGDDSNQDRHFARAHNTQFKAMPVKGQVERRAIDCCTIA